MSANNISSFSKAKKLLPNELLQMYRSRTKLTQADLAVLLGLKSFRMLQYWEGGYSLPRAEKLKKLIEVFVQHKVFLEGKELEEAHQLWSSVKNAADARLDSQTPYPIFDEFWLQKLLENRTAPLPETRPLIVERVTATKGAVTPPLVSKPRSNLPAALTSFIGRESEVALVCSRLQQPGVRLLTLIGVGGTGKTRLATQVAQVLLADFAHGCFFVALAAIREHLLVESAIAQVLGIRETEDRMPHLDKLKEYLYDKQMLLVLDNFEHMMEAAPLLVDLLKAAPQLKILVTSREILHLYGENQFEVLPLAQAEAVNLFVQRAQAVKSNFELNQENQADVAEICRRLDRLPLAIELAAARSKLFKPSALLTRLSDRLNLLMGGAQGMVEHQKTLRATLEWSYRLLSPEEQRLFSYLAVFAGGCRLEAVTAISQEANEIALLDRLTSLVDKSMVQQQTDSKGEYRFVVLETIREYGRERLEANGEIGELERRHAIYYLQFVEIATPKLARGEQVEWLDKLEEEHFNIRAALDYLQSDFAKTKSPELAIMIMKLAGLLWRFWWIRGYLSEGRVQLNRALRAAQEAGLSQSLGYSTLLNAAGALAYFQGDNAASRPYYEAALSLKRELGDQLGISTTLNGLGLVARTEGDYEAARQMHQESFDIKQELGDKLGSATSLNNLGLVAQLQHQYDEAKVFHEQSLALRRAFGDKQGIAHSLNNLGEIAYLQQHLIAAHALFAESLAFSQSLGDKQSISMSLRSLATVASAQGEYERAQELNGQSLALRQELGDKRGITECLVSFALFADASVKPERAARLLGVVAGLLGDRHGRITLLNQAEYEDALVSICQQLGEARFKRLSDEGSAMLLNQAINFALTEN